MWPCPPPRTPPRVSSSTRSTSSTGARSAAADRATRSGRRPTAPARPRHGPRTRCYLLVPIAGTSIPVRRNRTIKRPGLHWPCWPWWLCQGLPRGGSLQRPRAELASPAANRSPRPSEKWRATPGYSLGEMVPPSPRCGRPGPAVDVHPHLRRWHQVAVGERRVAAAQLRGVSEDAPELTRAGSPPPRGRRQTTAGPPFSGCARALG